MRHVTFCAVLLVLGVSSVIAQQGAKPRFEAASVRRATPGETGGWAQFLPGGRFRAQNVSLDFILQQVYELRDFQIVAAPEWRAVIADGRDRRYYIEATGPTATTERDVKEMVKTLLAERFNLRAHADTRELPVYALIVARGGVKAHKADGPDGGIESVAMGWVRGQRARIGFLVQTLSAMRVLDRPIVDRTGLDDLFDFDLTWSELDAAAPARLDGSCPASFGEIAARRGLKSNLSCPSIFTAFEEQLGLRLDAQKAPMDVLVIDSVQQPTEN